MAHPSWYLILNQFFFKQKNDLPINDKSVGAKRSTLDCPKLDH